MSRFDSRKITEGSLFVPLVGTQDGHEFIQRADAETAASLHFRSWPVNKHQKIFQSIPALSPLKATAAIGNLLLGKSKGAEVVYTRITGSNGKTTTKDRRVCTSENTKHIETQGNYKPIILVFLTLRFCMPIEIQKKSFGNGHG